MVTSCAAILNTGILVALLRNRLGGIDGLRLVIGTLKILVASAIFGVVCRSTLAFLQYHPLHGRIATVKVVSAENLLVCAFTGVLAYAIMAFVLRMEEAKMLVRIVRRGKNPG